MIKKSETAASMFIDEFQLSPKPDVKTLAKRFERLVNGKPGHKRNAAYIANWEGTSDDTVVCKRKRSVLQTKYRPLFPKIQTKFFDIFQKYRPLSFLCL